MSYYEEQIIEKIEYFNNKALRYSREYGETKPNFFEIRELRKELQDYVKYLKEDDTDSSLVKAATRMLTKPLNNLLGNVSNRNYKSFLYDISSYISVNELRNLL